MGSETGSEDERPVHNVYLDAFSIDVYEVTNIQFAEFLNEMDNRMEYGVNWFDANSIYSHVRLSEGVWKADKGYEEHPLVEVTWYGARAYCKWRGARLPTEAEWERAARGNLLGMLYPWGDDPPVCTPRDTNGALYQWCKSEVIAVGTFRQNSYGLFDMAGNVWEWIADRYTEDYYTKSPDRNPLGPTSGNLRVTRGGSWSDSADYLRVASRKGVAPESSNINVGFRCARDP